MAVVNNLNDRFAGCADDRIGDGVNMQHISSPGAAAVDTRRLVPFWIASASC